MSFSTNLTYNTFSLILLYFYFLELLRPLASCFSKCYFFLGHSIRAEAFFFMKSLPRVISSISSKSIVSEIYLPVILLIISAFDLYPRVVIALLLFPLIGSICSVYVITTLSLLSLCYFSSSLYIFFQLVF